MGRHLYVSSPAHEFSCTVAAIRVSPLIPGVLLNPLVIKGSVGSTGTYFAIKSRYHEYFGNAKAFVIAKIRYMAGLPKPNEQALWSALDVPLQRGAPHAPARRYLGCCGCLESFES